MLISSYGRIDQIFGPLAQWLEQGTHNPLVLGSNPRWPTYTRLKNNRNVAGVRLMVVPSFREAEKTPGSSIRVATEKA